MYPHTDFFIEITEWRGNFEFIGNKVIDKNKLEEFLN
jgi:hypothetical protein